MTIKSLEVVNFIGQLVFQENSIERIEHQINVSNLENGIYVLKIKTDRGTGRVKIIVSH